MKRIWTAALCLLLAALLCGCGLGGGSEAEQAARERCTEMMEGLTQGDWSAVEESLPLGGALTGGAPGEEAGILAGMLDGMSYRIRSAREQQDGSVVVEMKIQNVDMKALLESLPEDVSSTEEARQAMLERLPDAKRKSFDAAVTLVPRGEGEPPELRADVSFANALTGGLYDILEEMQKGAE